MLDDGVEEGRELGGEDEPGELLVEVDEAVLNRIQREVAIAGKAHGQAQRVIAVAVVEGFEGLGVAGVDRVDQIMVRAGVVLRVGVVSGL